MSQKLQMRASLGPECPREAPLVSIVVPHHNHTKWLSACIESCLAQDYRAIEILVIDDASTEDLTDVETRFRDRVQIIRLTSRVGPGEARNTGLREARGSLIQYLDADDVIAPTKLRRQVAALLRENADVVLGQWQGFLDIGGLHLKDPIQILAPGPRLLLETLADGDKWFPVMACLFKREFLATIGPWDGIDTIEDREYRYRILINRPHVALVDEVGFYYRRYPAVSRGRRIHYGEDVSKVRLTSDLAFLTRMVADIPKMIEPRDEIARAIYSYMTTMKHRYSRTPRQDRTGLEQALAAASHKIAILGADLDISQFTRNVFIPSVDENIASRIGKALLKALPKKRKPALRTGLQIVDWAGKWVRHTLGSGDR